MYYSKINQNKQNKIKCSALTKKKINCRNEADIGDKCYIHFKETNDDFDPCLICRNPNIPPKILRCGHTFHSRCIAQWYNDDMCRICEKKLNSQQAIGTILAMWGV